jgi:hypothetical protein
MEQITPYLKAKHNYVSHKVCQTATFALGAAATASLIWLTNYPALAAAGTAIVAMAGHHCPQIILTKSTMDSIQF